MIFTILPRLPLLKIDFIQSEIVLSMYIKNPNTNITKHRAGPESQTEADNIPSGIEKSVKAFSFSAERNRKRKTKKTENERFEGTHVKKFSNTDFPTALLTVFKLKGEQSAGVGSLHK